MQAKHIFACYQCDCAIVAHTVMRTKSHLPKCCRTAVVCISSIHTGFINQLANRTPRPVILFSNLNKTFLVCFNPININFHNENKLFRGEPTDQIKENIAQDSINMDNLLQCFAKIVPAVSVCIDPVLVMHRTLNTLSAVSL